MVTHRGKKHEPQTRQALAAIEAAENLERTAKRLRKDAAAMDEIAAWRERRDALKALGRRAALGEPVTAPPGTPAASVEHYAHKALRTDKQIARERQNIEIMKLARRGYSNRQIAARFKLSPATISRRLRQQIDKHWHDKN